MRKTIEVPLYPGGPNSYGRFLQYNPDHACRMLRTMRKFMLYWGEEDPCTEEMTFEKPEELEEIIQEIKILLNFAKGKEV